MTLVNDVHSRLNETEVDGVVAGGTPQYSRAGHAYRKSSPPPLSGVNAGGLPVA